MWVFHVFMHQTSVMVWQDGPWKLAASLQTLQSLCSPTELLSAPIPCFFLPTRRQRACEGREWGLQWKQHLFSDSCLLKRQLAQNERKWSEFLKSSQLWHKRGFKWMQFIITYSCFLSEHLNLYQSLSQDCSSKFMLETFSAVLLTMADVFLIGS